jgi:uncharacterized protein YndB with AHSA1/START domain
VTQPDPNDSVQLTRTIDAPPYEVYRAFLEPAQLRKWFGPAGFEVANVDVEARVGGRHHTVIAAPDGTRAAFVCEIRELVPGERIVMTFVFEGPESPPDPPETLLTITLGEAAPGSTELTLVHDRLVVPEPEEQDQIREGWAQALDKLESLYTNGGAGMTSTSSPG